MSNEPRPAGRWTWAALWLPGLFVATGAAVATAHGLFEVAVAAGAPTPIACLYPLITDGLALVAYGGTAQLRAGRGYAWTIVVLAAGLSGLAQAAYLAGGVEVPPPWLRFGVGAWPALAAAIVAHLLYLLGVHTADVQRPVHTSSDPAPAYSVNGLNDAVQRQPYDMPPQFDDTRPTEPAPARDRARAAARAFREEHAKLPTVSELTDLADVARGTAAAALRQLREERPSLQIVSADRKEPTEP